MQINVLCQYSAYFQTALKAQLLKPEMVCHKGHSQINCMQAISNGYVFMISRMDKLAALLNGVMEKWELLQIITQVITYAIGMVHFTVSSKSYVLSLNAILPECVFTTCHCF